MDHPNILWLHEIIDDKNNPNLCLVTEYQKNGSIGDLVKKSPNGIPYQLAQLFLIDIVKALYYCHNVINVIHRDIKPDNIMVNHNKQAVLIDFGLSALVDHQNDEMVSNVGSYIFFAPEMFMGKKSNVKVRGAFTDIWALGITLFNMVTG